MPRRVPQQIRYLQTSDGVRLAWAESGSGPPLVKASNWLTHLEYDLDSPVWSHWIRFFSSQFRFVRHDERACGMTLGGLGDLSLDRWLGDLEDVVDAANVREPFALLGISQGAATCIRYAVKHPHRVSHLVLYGAYARGVWQRGDEAAGRAYRAIVDLAETLWGSDNPAFRQVFTSRFVPGGSDEQLRWFNDVCRRTVSPGAAGPLLRARATVDVSEWLSQVRTPTLVLHGVEDAVVPIAEGQFLAASIPGARFVQLESRNHVLLENEPAWPRFCEEVREFVLGARPSAEGAVFDALSPRERQILAVMIEGCSNADIAERLSLSEKTVRNNISKIFDKLGVWTRAQAIVFAKDRGFGG